MEADDSAIIRGRSKSSLGALASGCTVAAILAAAVALTGWAIGSGVLRSLGQPIPMNPLVAMLVIACGIALLLLRGAPQRGIRSFLATVLGCSAIAGGTARLIGYAAHVEGGVDTLFFRSSLGDNQMAPNTALCVVLLGCSVILLPRRSQTARRCSGLLAFAAGIMALVSVLGYFLSLLALYQLGSHIPMSLNTAAALLGLSTSILLFRHEDSPLGPVMRNWTLERSIVAGFAGAITMLCLVSVISYQSTRALIEHNRMEGATLDELLHLTDLVSRLKSAETGQRGYLLTGDEQYLRPYDDAVARLGADVEALRLASGKVDEQQDRRNQLEPLIRLKLAELAHTITLRRENGPEAAMAVVKSGEGRRLMEQIEQLLAGMRSDENELLKVRSAAAVAAARRTITVVSVGSSLTVLIVIVAGVVIRRGISGRKAAERALRDAEERLRLLVSSVQDYAILMLHPDGRVASWNAGAQRIKGYRAEEIVGQHFSRFYPPEDQDKPARELEIASRTGKYEEEGWRVRKDGKRFWASVVITAVRDESGALRGFAKVTRDVTDRKRAEDEIRKLNDTLRQHAARLESANKELEAFSYSVSHDLRAPLRSIDGFSLALMEDYAGKLEPEARDYLQRVRAATKRMAQLIDDLLALSRVTRSEMSHAPVDLSAMARAVVAELKKANPDRQAEVEIADGLMAEGDSRLLRVVLDNLLGNAWKFTANRPGARIEFGTCGENGSRQFYVRDNGAGFDMTYAHKLFGAFQRLHANEEFAGTGVGLATVQRIINRHGGRISAEGAVGQGATFRFTL